MNLTELDNKFHYYAHSNKGIRPNYIWINPITYIQLVDEFNLMLGRYTVTAEKLSLTFRGAKFILSLRLTKNKVILL